MSLHSSSPEPDNLSDLASATIQKVHKAKPVSRKRNPSGLQIHVRDMSIDSSWTDSQTFPSSVLAESLLSPRLSSRFIPPPTPPPRAALPPTPEQAPSSDVLPPTSQANQPHGLGFEGIDTGSRRSSFFNSRQQQQQQQQQQQTFNTKSQTYDSKGRIISLSFSSPDSVESNLSPFHTENNSEVSTPHTERHSTSSSKSSFEKSKLLEEAKTSLVDQERALENLKRLSRAFPEASPPASPNFPAQQENPSSISSAIKSTTIDLLRGQEQTSSGHLHELGNRLCSQSQPLSRISENLNEFQTTQDAEIDEVRKINSGLASPIHPESSSFHRPSSQARAIEFLTMSSQLSRSLHPRSPNLPDSVSEQASQQVSSSSNTKTVPQSVRAMADSPNLSQSRESADSPRPFESEQIRALRYALRCALDEVDRYAEQLDEIKHEKRVLERQLKLAQSNLLLAEAQMSLMQEESLSDRRAQALRSEKLLSTTDGGGSASSSAAQLSSRTNRLSRSTLTLGSQISEVSTKNTLRGELERRDRIAQESAANDAGTSTLKKPKGGVSISSLRKAARAQATTSSGDQRYSHKGMRVGEDGRLIEEKGNNGIDDDDDDDDDLFDRPVPRPPPKQVTLSDFLESSRMTKEEMKEYSTNLESTSTNRAIGMRAASMGNMGSNGDSSDRKNAVSFFKSLSSKTTKAFDLPMLPKIGGAKSTKPSQQVINSRLDMFLEQSIVPADSSENSVDVAQKPSRNGDVHDDERQDSERVNAELMRRIDELEKRLESSVHSGSMAPSERERLSSWAGVVMAGASPPSHEFERPNNSINSTSTRNDLPRSYDRFRAPRKNSNAHGRTPSLHSFVSVTEGSRFSVIRSASP